MCMSLSLNINSLSLNDSYFTKKTIVLHNSRYCNAEVSVQFNTTCTHDYTSAPVEVISVIRDYRCLAKPVLIGSVNRANNLHEGYYYFLNRIKDNIVTQTVCFSNDAQTDQTSIYQQTCNIFLNKQHQRQDLPEVTICIVQTLQPFVPPTNTR